MQEINSGYRIRDADTLTQKAKTIYLYLRQRSGRNGKAWPGVKTIAGDLGFSESTVRRGISGKRRQNQQPIFSVADFSFSRQGDTLSMP